MGRTEPSLGQPPPAHRKDQRAKFAKATITKTIPSLLASNPRAKRGADWGQLIVDPPQFPVFSHFTSGPNVITEHPKPPKTNSQKKSKRKTGKADGDQWVLVEQEPGQLEAKSQLKIRLQVLDTLTCASLLVDPSSSSNSKNWTASNVAILNMASPLRPGGGVLTGATSQEEFLCTRTTLYPSLQESFYRLPEVGGIYTPDVLVFREGGPEAKDLKREERFWINVVSAGMLRFPEVERVGQGEGKNAPSQKRRDNIPSEAWSDDDEDEDDEEDDVEEFRYANEADRAKVLAMMKAVLRIMKARLVSKVVLGAWGCGAYGNPVPEIARAWKKVLLGNTTNRKKNSKPEDWSGIEEVVFAIKDRKMAEAFARYWGPDLEVEEGPSKDVEEGADEEHDEVAALEARIAELEIQASQASTPVLQTGLENILKGLKAQLPQKEAPGAVRIEEFDAIDALDTDDE
ncbi:hypothetical protein K402DRAFT_390354 [Aulographum hederae CBS 113979]|uniref:Microbial-type PARG catalytic domain-containing protein n=1 Tax=Aulographum hederae CBS 113979 TaxID=1176131 RepID=A0A6G1HAE5_9PEZI|nr:hypothetical protein K402DRAFT_390354 [Aulographum hederae CBS 113979]